MINIKIFKSSIANILKDYYQLFHLVIIKPKKIVEKKMISTVSLSHVSQVSVFTGLGRIL